MGIKIVFRIRRKMIVYNNFQALLSSISCKIMTFQKTVRLDIEVEIAVACDKNETCCRNSVKHQACLK